MKLTLTRKWYEDNRTMGRLKVDGTYFCFTLEDTARLEGVKVPGKTAIPAGTYKVIIDESVRFKRPMPHILDVNNFTGVRMHPGNDESNTEGCILLGFQKGPGGIWESKVAFDKLFPILQAAQDRKEEIVLEIINEP